MNNHEFVRQENKVIVEGDRPKITDFHIWNDADEDLTDSLLQHDGYQFWVVAYDMERTHEECFERINSLAAECAANKISFIGLTATPYTRLDPLRHKLNAAFPFYYGDGIVLKTIVRSNPGLVLLKGASVIEMWHGNDTPEWEEVQPLLK
jgi:hypothetical protein